jgi:hypothetical protein
MKRILTTAAVLAVCSLTATAFAQSGQQEFQKSLKEIKSMDTDGDGIISESEFTQATREHFSQVDVDKNEKLSQQEQQQMARIWAGDESARAQLKSDSSQDRAQLGSSGMESDSMKRDSDSMNTKEHDSL